MAIFGDFFASFVSASRVQHISDVHSKFALRPHHVWKYGTSNLRPLRLGEERKKEDRNHRAKIWRSALLHWATINSRLCLHAQHTVRIHSQTLLCTARLMAEGCQLAGGNAKRGRAEALKICPSLHCLLLLEIPRPWASPYTTCFIVQKHDIYHKTGSI